MPSQAIIIDGITVAESILDRLKQYLGTLEERLRPHLSVIQVGNDPSSCSYINAKRRAAEQIGIRFTHHHLSNSTTPHEVAALVHKLNTDPDVHGILVQLPLPNGFDRNIAELIDPAKDVDGFHPINRGRLASSGGLGAGLVPCTARACLQLLDHIGVDPSGKTAVVIGRSDIVGLPLAHLLIRHDATVTICHSKTVNLEAVVRTADLVFVAVGVPNFIKGHWLKPSAVVIDVGINSIPDPSKPSGRRLVGDVDFNDARLYASAISPVPKGVGPVTVAMLMDNTVQAALNQVQHEHASIDNSSRI